MNRFPSSSAEKDNFKAQNFKDVLSFSGETLDFRFVYGKLCDMARQMSSSYSLKVNISFDDFFDLAMDRVYYSIRARDESFTLSQFLSFSATTIRRHFINLITKENARSLSLARMFNASGIPFANIISTERVLDEQDLCDYLDRLLKLTFLRDPLLETRVSVLKLRSSGLRYKAVAQELGITESEAHSIYHSSIKCLKKRAGLLSNRNEISILLNCLA